MVKLSVVPSLEGIKDLKGKRAKIESRIYQIMNDLDPEGDNTKRWKEFFKGMNDTKFAEFMELIRKKEYQMNIIMPNMKKPLRIPNLLKAAEHLGLKIAHRLWLTDKVTGRKYLTNEKFMVMTLPIRRAQQEWDKKLSVPSRDKTIDSLTGQVMGDDRAAAISHIEFQSLDVRGLKNTMIELMRVRGGDVTAYGDFKRQMQETGRVTLESLDPSTRVRSADVAKVLLNGMMLDSNL